MFVRFFGYEISYNIDDCCTGHVPHFGDVVFRTMRRLLLCNVSVILLEIIVISCDIVISYDSIVISCDTVIFLTTVL